MTTICLLDETHSGFEGLGMHGAVELMGFLGDEILYVGIPDAMDKVSHGIDPADETLQIGVVDVVTVWLLQSLVSEIIWALPE